jgi:hypothetical protein
VYLEAPLQPIYKVRMDVVENHGLKLGSAQKTSVLACLEVRHSHNDRLRIERCCNRRNPRSKSIDKVLRLILIPTSELEDLDFGLLIHERVELDEC